jgi:endonuclease-3 related protein
MTIEDAFALLKALKKAGYIKNERDPLWWPQSGTFEVLVGAILTQQTKWENVERALVNLKNENLLHPEALVEVDTTYLKALIRPAGFYNTKAPRLQALVRAMLADFGDFKNFQKNVTRRWLLTQKGVGYETADSILCYGCLREVMVVDSYTARLLHALGYTLESYDEIQAWFYEGLEGRLNEMEALYGEAISMQTVYARLHGKIVEFAKEHIRGKRVDTDILTSF